MEIKKNVGIWVRVSTEFQVKDDSPEHHERRGKQYAEAKGWNVMEVYKLDAVSGKSVMEHFETKRMLHDLKSGRITGLIFSKLARLARNTKELLEFSEIFRSHDADLISLSESIDTSSSAGRLFYTMIAALSEWERGEIAERVAASVPIRAKMGKPLGGAAPYGYKWVGKKLKVDQDEAPVRKLVYELFLEHKRKSTTARMLNEKGHRTRNGSPFSDTTIGRLLRDPIAKGLRRANYTKSLGTNKKWVIKPESEWVLTSCPAVVEAELWNQCNRILDEQEKTNRKPTKKPMHLFTGIVFCTCSNKMYIPSGGTKYACAKDKDNRIAASDLEEIYYTYLKSFLLTDEQVDTYLLKANSVIKTKEEQLQILLKDQKRVQGEMDKLVQLHLTTEMPQDGFRKYYKPLDEQLKQIESTIPEVQGEIDFLKIEYLHGDQILSDAKNLYERWQTLTHESKRQIIEQLTERITIDKENIQIKFSYNPSISQIAPESQHNLIHALPFSNLKISLKREIKGMPLKLNSIGDHIRKRRVELKLTQEAAALQLEVSTDTVTFWESRRFQPKIHNVPKIIKFLGYNPYPIEKAILGARVKYYRLMHGLSHKKFGILFQVDASTVGSWENERSSPHASTKAKLEVLLSTLV